MEDRDIVDTDYHLAYRDLGGAYTGTATKKQVWIHITRLLRVCEEMLPDDAPGEQIATQLWYRWLRTEHHEWLHALMHRWKIRGWTSESRVETGTDMIMRGLVGIDILARDVFSPEDFNGYRREVKREREKQTRLEDWGAETWR